MNLWIRVRVCIYLPANLQVQVIKTGWEEIWRVRAWTEKTVHEHIARSKGREIYVCFEMQIVYMPLQGDA